jgi:hypothetical protein
MSITASGAYSKTYEKMMIDTAGQSLESETVVKGLLVLDAYTPDFDVHDFRDDVTNEATGTGYSSGGVVLTTTDITLASPSAGSMKYDHDDPQWSSSSIANAMALVEYFNVGSSATDMLLHLLDFVTAVTTSSGLLLVQIAANGVWNLDHVA